MSDTLKLKIGAGSDGTQLMESLVLECRKAMLSLDALYKKGVDVKKVDLDAASVGFFAGYMEAWACIGQSLNQEALYALTSIMIGSWPEAARMATVLADRVIDPVNKMKLAEVHLDEMEKRMDAVAPSPKGKKSKRDKLNRDLLEKFRNDRDLDEAPSKKDIN